MIEVDTSSNLCADKIDTLQCDQTISQMHSMGNFNPMQVNSLLEPATV